MELGATVCKPVGPDCAACPVRGACRAHAEWQVRQVLCEGLRAIRVAAKQSQCSGIVLGVARGLMHTLPVLMRPTTFSRPCTSGTFCGIAVHHISTL